MEKYKTVTVTILLLVAATAIAYITYKASVIQQENERLNEQIKLIISNYNDTQDDLELQNELLGKETRMIADRNFIVKDACEKYIGDALIFIMPNEDNYEVIAESVNLISIIKDQEPELKHVSLIIGFQNKNILETKSYLGMIPSNVSVYNCKISQLIRNINLEVSFPALFIIKGNYCRYIFKISPDLLRTRERLKILFNNYSKDKNGK